MPFTPPPVKTIDFASLVASLMINPGSLFNELDEHDKEATQYLENALYVNLADPEAQKLLGAYHFLVGAGFYKQLCILVDLYRKLPSYMQGAFNPNPSYTGGGPSSPAIIDELIKLRQDFLAQPNRDEFMRRWVEITNKINPYLKLTGYNLSLPDSKEWQRSNIDHVLSTKDPLKFNKKLVSLLESAKPTALLSLMNNASLRKKERYSVLKNWLLIAKHIQADNLRRAYDLLRPMVHAGNELAIEVIVLLYTHSKPTFLLDDVLKAINELCSTPSISGGWPDSKNRYFKCMAQRIKVLQDSSFDEYLTCLEMKENELNMRRCPEAAKVFSTLTKKLKECKREFLQKPPATSPTDERVLGRAFLIKCQEHVERARNMPIIAEHRGLGDLIARLLNNMAYILSFGQYNPRAPMVRGDTYGFFRPKAHSLVVLEKNPFPEAANSVF